MKNRFAAWGHRTAMIEDGYGPDPLYYSLSQSGRIRNDGETDLNWEIFKDFRMTITFYNNYDSKPPTTTSEKFDFGIVFGLSLKF